MSDAKQALPGEAVVANTGIVNPVPYFEVPVADMDRAVRFYEAVFGWTLERQIVDGYEMALLPFDPDAPGATGALAKGDVYVPSITGPILYFRVDDIDAVMDRALAAGGRTLYAKKDVGAFGLVAEFQDTEGNRIALNQVPD
jgi:predicted enzyme related to lactoylglutathione lyase